jgi:hypothetical protein
MSEEQSPLDIDPLGSNPGTPAGGCELYNTPTFFRRFSREFRPTPIAV